LEGEVLKMRRFYRAFCIAFLAACASVLLLAPVPVMPPAEGASITNVRFVEGVFDVLENTKNGWVITLIVNGMTASGPVSKSCLYYDHRENEVPRQEFMEAFLGENITVEISDKTGEVLACRAEPYLYAN
jgi:hypothetical protein